MACPRRDHALLRASLLAAAIVAGGGCASGHAARADDDRAVTGRIESLLAQHAALQAPNLVAVQTIGHVVYLKGLVDTPYQRQLAESIAAQGDEGLPVVNLIAVQNTR